MAASQACESNVLPLIEDTRIHWTDRMFEFAFDWALVQVAFILSTWPQFSETAEPFRLGLVEFPSRAVALTLGFEAVLLLTRRQTFGMIIINAHVARAGSGVEVGPLRAAVPRVMVYGCLFGTWGSEGRSGYTLGAFVAMDVLWALFDRGHRFLHNRLFGTEVRYR